jgi:hypothetical protein
MALALKTRAANGALVHVDIDDTSAELIDHPWFGHVRFTPRYGRGTATAEMWGADLAPASSLAAGIASVQGVERERFTIAGGELVIVDCGNQKGARWAAWVGPWNMVHGFFYEPMWETADVVELFSRVKWVDTPEGMTADPAPRYDFSMAMCLLSITGVGMLRVESKQLSSSRPPRWRGALVPAGEVWQIPDRSGVAQTSFLHVTGSAVALLIPGDVPKRYTAVPTGRSGAGTPQRALEFLGTVRRVDWAAA